METGKTNKEIDPHIMNSWLHLKKTDLSPYKEDIDLEPISQEELASRREELSRELKIIKKYMNYLYNFTRGSGYLLSFIDKENYILEVLGEEYLENEFAEKFSYYPGIKWTEEKVGNNASELALIRGKPVQVVGAQHYCKVFHDWGCSAAPVRNEEGDIFGVLKISGLSGTVNSDTLGMVVTCARAINNQLKLKNLNKKLQQKNEMEKAIVSSISEGLLYVDKDGIIKFINKTGAEILNVDREEAINKHVTEIVDFRPVILDVLESGEGYEDKEFYLKSDGELLHFIKTTKVLRDKEGNIRGVVDSFKEIKRIKKMVNNLTGAQAQFDFDDIKGRSSKIKECKKKAELAAEVDSNVIIQGETGVGKELFAQAIHRESRRKDGPFVALNCAALSPQLIESELFGYVEGAFTGAKKGGRPGKFELANGGTILLDEIAEIPLNMQAKLLRVLQEKQIIRIGGNEYIPVDVRVICATNKNLLKEIENGNFRQDLYYRLNVLNLHIPPLRERKGDIILLAQNFLERISQRLNKNIKGFTEAAKNYLKNYDWPGNVRELENIIEKVANYCEKDYIDYKLMTKLHETKETEFASNRDLTSNDKIIPLEDKKKAYIKEVVDRCDNNISRAAELLEVSRRTVYKWLDE